MKTEKYLSFKY